MSERLLQAHDMAARGFPPGTAPPERITRMAIVSQGRGGPMFVPDEDVTQEIDGRTIQVAVKGVPMPLATAIKYGLTPDPFAPVTGPSETKEGPRHAAPAPKRPAVPGASSDEEAP